MRRPSRLPPALALLPVLAGCPGTLDDVERFTGPVGDACAGIELQTFFEDTCGTGICHEGPGQDAPFDLLSPGVRDRLVDVPAEGADGCVPTGRLLVDSSDPSQSYLLEKLDGRVPACGEPMPVLQPALTPEQLACVEQWIESLVAPAGGGDAGVPGGDGGT